MAEKKISDFQTKEEQKEEQKDEIRELAEKIRGKVVVVFGEPLVGKTVLAHLLSRYFEKPLLLKVDNNYGEEYRELNPKLKYLDAPSFEKVLFYLDKSKEFDNDLIIIDSLTSLASEILSKGSLSPRDYNRLASMYDIVTFKASRLKPRTVVIVAHERITTFETKEVGPRMNKVALRNIDMLIRVYKDQEGNRIISIVAERKPDIKNIAYKYEAKA